MIRAKPLCVHEPLKSAPSVCTYVCTRHAGEGPDAGQNQQVGRRKTQARRAPGRYRFRGFIARCLPSGDITYGYRYRAAGKQRWLPLGATARSTAEQARKAAKVAAARWPRARSSGEKQARLDPVHRQHTPRPVHGAVRSRIAGRPTRSGAPSTARSGPRSAPIIYNLKRSDIMQMLDEIATRGPVMAGSVVAFLSKAFNWWELRDEVPQPDHPGHATMQACRAGPQAHAR